MEQDMADRPLTDFGLPMVPISGPVHSLPYEHCPNVMIGYPNREDWEALYDPKGSKPATWKDENYAAFKRRHERTVREQLDKIHPRLTGKAVFAEIRTKPSYSVMIFPYDFLPVIDEFGRPTGTNNVAVTMPLEYNAALLEATPICSRGANGKQVCTQRPRTATGSATDIFYTPSRSEYEGSPHGPDATLIHELVHASRHVKGVIYNHPITGGYNNYEEFFAVLIQNIYLSETGKPDLYDYKGDPINTSKFLDTQLKPPPREAVAKLRATQPVLFANLAGLPPVPRFNPIKQFEAEFQAQKRKGQRTR
jgi:hypothetical protein